MAIYNCHKMQISSLKPRNKKYESFIDTLSYDDQEFFHVLSPQNVSNVETERPIYDQIVEQEIIELH